MKRNATSHSAAIYNNYYYYDNNSNFLEYLVNPIQCTREI